MTDFGVPLFFKRFSPVINFPMKRIASTPRFFVALVAVGMATLTSCNRGVGCPTNFSLNEFLHDCVSVAISIF